MKRSYRVLRAISFVLLQSFIAQQIVWADIIPSKQNVLSKPEVSLALPLSVASIEDAYRNGNGTLFYLIQDAHTNESGQLNLAKTLDVILEKEKDLDLVFVEAGLGDNSLSFLRKYSSLADRRKAAMTYIKTGLLHGEEYLDLTSDRDFTLWGVEDPSLYVRTLENYRAVAKDRERFDLYLKKIEVTIGTLKDRLMNPALYAFDAERTKFQKETLPLTAYFDALQRESTMRNISLSGYPQLSKLKDLKEKESRVDFERANQEQRKAFTGLSAEIQKELKELSDAEGNSPFKVSSKDARGEKAFYAYLEEKLQSRSKDFPELFKYFDYLKLARSIEAKHVLDEIQALETRILNALTRTEDKRC